MAEKMLNVNRNWYHVRGMDKPWPPAHQKNGFLYYLIIGAEGRRILDCKNPHIMIDALSTAECRIIVEAAFIRPQGLTFDRHVFLIRKQLRGETAKNFYGKRKDLAEICDFENKEEILIRKVFFTNLIDPQIQKGLPNQTVGPRQALKLTKNVEIGMRDQHQIP